MSINNQRILKAIAQIEKELDSLKFALKTEIPEGADLSNYYTKNETYNKTETDNKFALKTEIPEDADLSNYYTKNETYNKTETDDKFALKEITYTKLECDMKYVNNDNYIVFTQANGLDGKYTLNSVCYGNDMFVTVAFEGICAWSRNGNTYIKGTISNNVWKSVCYGDNLFVAVGDNACAWSEDGYTFTDGTISSQKWIGVCYGKVQSTEGEAHGIYAAVSTTGCATSTDGKVFEDGNSYDFECINVVGICYGMNLFVIACANGIFYSSDGKTYTKATVEGVGWSGICYGKVQSTEGEAHNLFVAVSDSDYAYSEDGKTFTRMEMDSSTFASIAYGNNMFLAISMRGGYAFSYDGKTFKYGGLSNISFNIFRSICYSDESNGMFSVVGGSSLIGSTTGKFATARDFLSKNDAYKKYESDEKYLSKGEADNKYVNVNNYILFSNLEYNDYNFSSVCYYDMYNRYVAVSINGKCAWSNNGNTYTEGTISNNVWRCVCHGNISFVAVGDNACAWSEDGITFTDGTISNQQWHSICYGYGRYVAVSTTGCATSTDGKVFEDGNSYDFEFLNNIDICYGMGLFLVACGTGIYYSSDGLTFTKAEIDNAEITGWCGICYGNEMFVAFNMGHTAYSYDGMKFITVSFTNNMWVSMTYGNNMFLAVSMETEYAFSRDGKTFTVGGDTNSGYFNSICYGNEKFVAVGGRYTSSTTGKFVNARDFLTKIDAYTKEECDEKYALKKADSLNVVHNDRTLKITGDTESNKFNVDITTTSNTTNIMQIGLGKVDFGYNQIRTQHLVLAEQSLQQIIRSDMSKKPKSTDVSLYTALMIDDNFYNKTEVDTKISEVKTDIPEDVDLSNYYTKSEVDDKFVINDYGNELSFTDGTIGTGSWRSVCYGNGMFVAVSNDNKCAWSTDGKIFTNGTISANQWRSVCYGNGMFVAVSADGKCAWSTDGKTFTNGTISTGTWFSVCYGNGMFVAVSNDNKCAWSTDGKTFTNGTIDSGSWSSVCYGNRMFVAVNYNSKCAWSTDGKTFTNGTISTGTWNCVCYGNEMFVAVSSDAKCAWSTDGKTFTEGTIDSGLWRSVCYGNGMFVAVNYNSKCAWSTDGKIFTNGTIGTGYWYNVCYGNEMFVAVGYNGKCVWSEFRIVTARSFALKTTIQKSMTITHLAPIDEEYSINEFVIGTPVYMTGNVYVKDWENNTWYKSTINDSIDCISSVKTNGTWKEYLGICTHILSESNENEVLSRNCGEIKFATHGDYLVNVDNSSIYSVSDTLYIDYENDEPKLKILDVNMSLNIKIQRTIVGIITSIIDEKTVSVFKA